MKSISVSELHASADGARCSPGCVRQLNEIPSADVGGDIFADSRDGAAGLAGNRVSGRWKGKKVLPISGSLRNFQDQTLHSASFP